MSKIFGVWNAEPGEDEDDEPVFVKADSAVEAAKQVIGPGPYQFVNEPKGWKSLKPVMVSVHDNDGSKFTCKVIGPVVRRSFGIGDVVRYKGKRWRVEGWTYQKGAVMTGPTSAPAGKVAKLILRQDMKSNEIQISPSDPDLEMAPNEHMTD